MSSYKPWLALALIALALLVGYVWLYMEWR